MIDKKLILKALEFYGVDAQLKKTAEECAELIQAIMKNESTYNVAEEIADVLICLEYLKEIYGISDRTLQAHILEKSQRLEDRMEQTLRGCP